VVALASPGAVYAKTAANIRELIGFGAKVVVVGDAAAAAEFADTAFATVAMPTTADFVAPILYAIPMQLLAYHVALRKGVDVDRPRNLSKSVIGE